MNDFFETAKNHGVKAVHLVTGEDIIGEVFLDEVNEQFIIRNPVVPHITANENGFRMGLMPLRPYAREIDALPIPPSTVIWAIPVDNGVEKNYREFTSKIVIAPANTPLPKVSL